MDETTKNYMRYIPKEYKREVDQIFPGWVEWNKVSKRFNIIITVIWKDGQSNHYQNASYMYEKLKEFGR